MFNSHPDHELLIAHETLERHRAEAAEHRLAESGTSGTGTPGGRRLRVVVLLVIVLLTTVAVFAFDWQRTTDAFAPPADEETRLSEASPHELDRGDTPTLGCPTIASPEVTGPIFRPVWVHFT